MAPQGKCKITVLKRNLNQDLVNEYLQDPGEHPGVCEYLEEGQEFIVESVWEAPEGLCPWAWADIRKEIVAAQGGGHYPGMKQAGVFLGSCSDWFRPVVFKIEQMP